MTKLSNTEAELKKALLIKKRVVDGFYLLDVLQVLDTSLLKAIGSWL